MSHAQAINLDVMPKRHWSVRRRHFADGLHLVRGASFYRIEAFADAVWLACNGSLCAFEMAEALRQSSATDEGLNLLEDLTRVLRAFEQQSLIEPIGWGDPELAARKSAAEERTAIEDVMRDFVADGLVRWMVGLSAAQVARVVTRFLQILAEAAERAAAFEPSARAEEREQRFSATLARRYRKDPGATHDWLRSDIGLLAWSFKPREEQIVITMQRSVYVGDIWHRH